MLSRFFYTVFYLRESCISKRVSTLSILFIIFTISTTLYAQNHESAQSNAEKAELTEKQLETVTKKIQELQRELGKDKSFQQKEQNSLKQVETELSKLYLESRELKKQQQEIKKKISGLELEQNQLKQKNNQQKIALNKDLQTIYKVGKQEKIKLLLNQENPQDLARILKYYDYYSEARVNRILAYQENIKAIDAKKIKIQQELEQLNIVEANISKQAAELKMGQDKRKQVLDTLSQKIKTKDQELKNLQENQNQLSKLLRSLKGIWADIPNKLNQSSFKKNKGKLPYPVAGKVSNNFGSKRVGGRLEWNGWLITTPLNEDVRAIYDGRVVFSDWIRGYGLLIIVDHNEGYLSLYGHNASLLKEAGEWIRAGDVLATTGNSGGQYEPGLYFELRLDGEPLNPRSWLHR